MKDDQSDTDDTDIFGQKTQMNNNLRDVKIHKSNGPARVPVDEENAKILAVDADSTNDDLSGINSSHAFSTTLTQVSNLN